jgi:hypothetical protein
MEVTCPSGLKGVLKKPKVRTLNDMRKIAARQGQAQSFTHLLESCWAKTLEKGVYRFEGDEVPWRDVLTGDRYYLILGIRKVLYGPNYQFPVRCKGCTKKFGWVLPLDELEVTPLPDESKKVFMSEEKLFERKTEGGMPFRFKLSTGRTEEEKRDEEEQIVRYLMPRLFSLGDVTNRKKLEETLLDLDLDVFDDILAQVRGADCGVETEIEVQCDHCNAYSSVTLPFDRKYFFPKSMG